MPTDLLTVDIAAEVFTDENGDPYSGPSIGNSDKDIFYNSSSEISTFPTSWTTTRNGCNKKSTVCTRPC